MGDKPLFDYNEWYMGFKYRPIFRGGEYQIRKYGHFWRNKKCQCKSVLVFGGNCEEALILTLGFGGEFARIAGSPTWIAEFYPEKKNYLACGTSIGGGPI